MRICGHLLAVAAGREIAKHLGISLLLLSVLYSWERQRSVAIGRVGRH